MLKLLFVIFTATLYSQSVFAAPSPSIDITDPAIPKFDQAFWSDLAINEKNNCYNYATNRAEGSWAQPGDASQSKYEEFTCASVYKAASMDWGLTPTNYFPLDTNPLETLIALVVYPGHDFHWFRRDNDNSWSHKMNFAVLDVDFSGHKILDPETADRGRYTDFCGYFKVKNYFISPVEQNAGFVRIGKMTDWPQSTYTEKLLSPLNLPPRSRIILPYFSGKANPSIPLSEIIEDKAIHKFLHKVALQLKTSARRSISRKKNILPDLIITDPEGILIPPQSRLEMKDNNWTLTFKDQTFSTMRSTISAKLKNRLKKFEADGPAHRKDLALDL